MRPLECSLGILAIISGLILLIPGLSALLKNKFNPVILGLAALAQIWYSTTPAAEVYTAREIVVFKKNGVTEFTRLGIDSNGWYQGELPVGFM